MIENKEESKLKIFNRDDNYYDSIGTLDGTVIPTIKVLENKIYTFENGTLTEIIKNGDEFSTLAFSINVGNSQTFNISYILDVNKFDNSYKNATVSCSTRAFAIQQQAIENQTIATSMLFEQFIEV